MKEKLQEYALIAEIVGGIAIILSLIFVGMQINQNYEMMRYQTRSELALALSQRMWDAANSPYFSSINFAVDPDTLTGLDKERQKTGFNSIFRLYENMYYQYKNGLFDEDEFNVEAQAWKDIVNLKGPSELLCSQPEVWSKEFIDFLFGMMEMPC